LEKHTENFQTKLENAQEEERVEDGTTRYDRLYLERTQDEIQEGLHGDKRTDMFF
jgi:hypothetical protein